MTLRELLAWDSFKAFWWKNSQFQHAIITSASKSNPWCLCSLWFQCHICDGSSKLLWSEEKAVVAESLCPVVALPGATGWWDQTAEPLPLCGLGHPQAVRKPFHLWLAPHPGSALSKQRNLKFAIQSNLKKENKNFIIPCTHLPIAYFECVLNSTFQNWDRDGSNTRTWGEGMLHSSPPHPPFPRAHPADRCQKGRNVSKC